MSLAATDFNVLQQRYPLTTSHFLQMPQGRESLAHVQSLDRRWASLIRGENLPADVHYSDPPPTEAEFDVIVAGGSLGLLTALSLARRGWRVMVFDQRVAGSAHREWNISQEEAQALVRGGLFTLADLNRVAMRHYRSGLVRFAGGQAATHELWLDDVLDVAIDAGALLRLARTKLEALGVVLLDHREFRSVWLARSGPARSVVEVSTPDGKLERYGARLLVNALGATSPLSLALAATPFSGVCPTVGTVARGYASSGARGVDLDLGEILVTTAHADDEGRRQLMWEGFPGRDDELTVYLFYYDVVDPQRPQSLLGLFEVYFARLAEYKAPGPDFEHLRPVYGFIPSRHGVDPMVNARGVLAVGDASAHQSPLTFCGFGSFVRNLERVASLADYALRHDRLEAHDLAHISARQTNVSLMWVFARFMSPWRGGSEVNDIMNRFLGVLASLGEDVARRFFQDRTTWRDYTLMLLRFAAVFPTVLVWALDVLGWAGIGQWARDYARFTRHALMGWLLSHVGHSARSTLLAVASRLDSRWGLRLRAWLGEWEVSKPA